MKSLQTAIGAPEVDSLWCPPAVESGLNTHQTTAALEQDRGRFRVAEGPGRLATLTRNASPLARAPYSSVVRVREAGAPGQGRNSDPQVADHVPKL